MGNLSCPAGPDVLKCSSQNHERRISVVHVESVHHHVLTVAESHFPVRCVIMPVASPTVAQDEYELRPVTLPRLEPGNRSRVSRWRHQFHKQ